MFRPWLPALLAFAASGCLVTPPAVQVTGGPAVRSGAGSSAADGPFQFRAGIHPLQVVHEYTHRDFDFGVGYLLDAGTGGPKRMVHGGYGEGSYIFLKDTIGTEAYSRLAVRGQARVLVDQHGTTGPGAAVQLTGEVGGWIKPICGGAVGAKAAVAGCAATEGSVGFYLEVAGGSLYGAPIWTGGGGLLFRTPAIIGLGL